MIMKKNVFNKWILLLSLIVISCTETEFISDDKKNNMIDSRSLVEEHHLTRCGNENYISTRGLISPPISVKALDTLSKTICLYNVYIHIVRSETDNSLNKESICYTIMDSLNRKFYKRSIFFNLIGSEFIDSDYHDSITESEADEIFGTNAHTNAIDIYVLANVGCVTTIENGIIL